MVRLMAPLSLLKPAKILVVGDLMLDRYTMGKASRISPEAPVPVLHVKKELSLPGGAGNVALNLVSLGQEVVLVGRYGLDSAGRELAEALKSEGINTRGLFADDQFQTPIKNRIIADSQQMIRIDHEEISLLSQSLEKKILEAFPELLEGVKVVAISDYAKGFLSKGLLAGIIAEAKKRNILVIADPKGADFQKYRGATVLKPNLKEAYAASKMPLEATLDEVAQKLLEIAEIEELLVTRSEAGISIFNRTLRRDYPVKSKEVKDVTGAGDTVLAACAAALASDLTLDQAAELANIAASIVVEHVGCARVSLAEMAARLLDEHASHKIIEPPLKEAFHFALKGRPHTIIELSCQATFDNLLFQQIQKAKTSPIHTLVMSVPASPACPDLIPMLTSLREVDFVLKGGSA